MTCPGCGAAMRLDPENNLFLCDYCERVHRPDPDSEGVRVLEPSDLECPACARRLSLAVVGGQRVHYCEGCKGLLAEMGILVAMIGVLRAGRGSFTGDPAPLNRRDLERRIRCPHCLGAMDTHPYGGPGNIVIDSCEVCGCAWLDGGELARIVDAPDRAYSAG